MTTINLVLLTYLISKEYLKQVEGRINLIDSPETPIPPSSRPATSDSRFSRRFANYFFGNSGNRRARNCPQSRSVRSRIPRALEPSSSLDVR